MWRYALKRLLLIVPTFLGVSVIIFVLLRAIPGDAALMLLRAGETGAGTFGAEAYEELRREFGLDRPLWEQYVIWLGGVLRGDWGESLYTGDPVIQQLAGRLPVTFELAVLTIALAWLIAIPAGVVSALKQDTFADYIARLVPIAFLSMPNFWIGTVLIMVPALFWKYLPPLHYIPVYENPGQNLLQFLFPALSLGAFSSAVLARLTRSAMLEVLRQDYIRTAWAKGLREGTVIYRHALKNALIPVVTVAGLQFNGLLGGTVILETLYGLPGVGSLTLLAINQRDYPQVQANVVFFASAYVLINLAMDLFYAALDPRIRYQ